MRYIKQSTPVPNKVFDINLKMLTEKELKVLLVIIRQTLGWMDKDGNRKMRDWISQRYFINKTGLSGRSVSEAINLLVTSNIIVTTDKNYNLLQYKNERRSADKVYYELYMFHKNRNTPRKNSNTTKQTCYKRNVYRDHFSSVGEVFNQRASQG